MRFVGQSASLAFALTAVVSSAAQSPTMKQIMLDLIHPSANDILLVVNRGGPADEKEWAVVRRSAITLVESGKALTAQIDSAEWRNAAKMLTDAGSEAYKAAQAKDVKALSASTANIDASCTNCHKQFRPNVFPRQGGGQ